MTTIAMAAGNVTLLVVASLCSCLVAACSFDPESDSLLPHRAAAGATTASPDGSGGMSSSSSSPPAPPRASGSSGANASSGSASGASTNGAPSTTPPSTTPPATTPPATTPPATTPPAGFDAFQQHNVDVINKYRAAQGIAPLTLDLKLSAFALAGSQELSVDHSPHQHFITASSTPAFFTDGFSGGGAENQGSPTGWPVMATDPTQNELAQIDQIQQVMFNEGPGGGHHDNMMNAGYKRVGVGLLEISGQLYLTNDFSP